MKRNLFTEDERAMLEDAGWEVNLSEDKANKDWRKMKKLGDRVLVEVWMDDSGWNTGWWEDDNLFKTVEDAIKGINPL